MTVKDLVQQYDSFSKATPRLARFITPPLRVSPQQIGVSKPPISPGISQSTTLKEQGLTESRSDLDTYGSRYPKESDNEAVESLLHYTYPPTTRPNSYRGRISQSLFNQHPNHRPIPATLLFARSANPLSLPNLDRYLSSLVPPVFSSKKQEGPIFPPLQKLENTGITLDDLEHNAKIPPAWRDRTGILWTIVSSFISVLVCTTRSTTASPANNYSRVRVLLHHFIACKA